MTRPAAREVLEAVGQVLDELDVLRGTLRRLLDAGTPQATGAHVIELDPDEAERLRRLAT